MTYVYVSLGSNLLNPPYQINKALIALNLIQKTQVIAISSFYRTIPYGHSLVNQPDYLNIAVTINTELNPDNLLSEFQLIELKQGRVRSITNRWAARTLDIDIMLFGKSIINTSRITIPHYDMLKRIFMLLPLIEIAPKITLPDGRSIKTFLKKLDNTNISYWYK